MASEVKTNKVSPATANTLNVGDAGDTLALAVDDVTGFNVGSDAAGDVLYNDGTDYTRLAKPGTPAGEVLTFATSATAPSWVAAAAGGLTAASQWRLTTGFNGAATPILNPTPGELEEVDSPVGFGVLGDSMVCSTGGIFTFPSTGYWLISFNIAFYWAAAARILLLNGNIQTTTNDGTYADASEGMAFFRGSPAQYTSETSQYIFDVTSTSTHKCRFTVATSGEAATILGDTAKNETYMTFLRLADTP
jgi:hypothetical protein